MAAILIARRSTRSIEDGSTIRVDHLVTGRAIETRSAAICASIESYRMPDSPAITTSGAPPRFAWYIIPIPLPSPTPLWSWTTVGFCVARA